MNLRGLGRSAFRAGLTASQAVQFAARALHLELDDEERMLVMSGWRDERSESVK